MEKESIFCIQRGMAEDFLGITRNTSSYVKLRRSKSREQKLSMLFNNLSIHERTEKLEKNTDLLQVIPYITLDTGLYLRNTYGRILTYSRNASKDGDKRLDTKYSIGIGGHWRSNEKFEECIKRELTEELGEIVFTYLREEQRKAIKEENLFDNISGLIFSDENEVSSVHLGIHVEFNRTGLFYSKGSINAEWYERKEIRLISDKLETWSKLCFNNLKTI